MTRKNTPVRNQAKPKRKPRASVNDDREVTREVTRDSREAHTREVQNPHEDKQLNDQQRAAVTKFVRATLANGIEKLKAEYEQLREFKPPDNAKTAFAANLKKSRYKDVFCWDRTRVKLTFGGDDGDFIHANHVVNEVLLNRFICCQGPLEATVIDFWRMVWQEHVPLIIMLCQVREQGKGKCAQYWPLKEGDSKSYGKITVSCDSVCTRDPNITLTKLIVEFRNEKRILEHRQWITWPDKTVPKSSSVAFRLLHFPREYTNHPSIVHCSAGVGRTGTLVALEIVLRTLLGADGEKIKIIEIVKELRCARSQAVQTEDQYVYIHFAMCQYAVMKKFLPREEIEGFIKDYEDYLKTVETGVSGKGKKKTPVKLPASAELIEEKPEELRLQTPEEIKEEDNKILPLPPSPGGPVMTPLTPAQVAATGGEREKSLMMAQPTLQVAVAVPTLVANLVPVENKAIFPDHQQPKPFPQTQIPPQQPAFTPTPAAVPVVPPPPPQALPMQPQPMAGAVAPTIFPQPAVNPTAAAPLPIVNQFPPPVSPPPPAMPQARPAISMYKPPVVPFRPGSSAAVQPQPFPRSAAMMRSNPSNVQRPMTPVSPGKPAIIYQKSNAIPIKVIAGPRPPMNPAQQTTSTYKVIQPQQPPNGLPPGQNAPKPF